MARCAKSFLPRGLRLWPGIFAALAGWGCADRNDSGPPDLHLGEDTCSACQMIVSEEGYASALVVRSDGVFSSHVFDDIGCLFLWAKSSDTAPSTRWVRAFAVEKWLSAESAFYVRSSEIRSPMGSGVAACATADEAAVLAREKGGVTLTWMELAALDSREGLLAPPPAAGRSTREPRSGG